MIAIVDAPIARDVDWTEESERAWLGAHDDARARRVDRLARDAHLRVRTAVVLEHLHGTLARCLLAPRR